MRCKRWVANILCSFIPNELRRRRLRTKLRFDTTWCNDFVKQYMHDDNVQMSAYVGNGCQNYVIVANKQFVFKFPIRDGKIKDATIEQRVSTALAKISPCRVPALDIIKHNGKDISKYDFINGVTIADANKQMVRANIHKIAEQIAEFLFALSVADPKDIADLKPADAQPCHFMYGWGHRDIGGNFVLDTNTMDIVGFIDWENAGYGDLTRDFYAAAHYWAQYGYPELGAYVMAEYAKKYINHLVNQ